MGNHRTTLLVILDGWGIPSKADRDTVVNSANAPHFFARLNNSPHAALVASGEAVGLFRGQEGNSEAGHLNLGAGRVVKQDALYISEAITDGTFFKNNAFHQAIHHVKKYRTAVHVMGLLSNHNSAHSCPEHLYSLLRLFRKEGIEKIYLHLFTDGRDSGQHDALRHLEKLQSHFQGNERIATVMGRLYAMDRNKNWERTRAAYDALVLGKADRRAASVTEAFEQAYNRGESDEFIQPTIITCGSPQSAIIKDNDAVFFFNLRSDRARQITKTLVQPHFETDNPNSFKRAAVPKNIRFVAMTDFGPDLPGVLTAFPSRDVVNSLVQVLCPRRQLYVAESEKFAHITYFFNGGYANHFCDETWIKIPSHTIQDFRKFPRMKARQIADYVIKAIRTGHYDFIAVNFANADMIGHTGDRKAAERAVTTLDTELARIVATLLKREGQGIITADHGNIEEITNPATNEIDTEHSTNCVPCIILAPDERYKKWSISKRHSLPSGKLANIAPTLLKMMGVPKPKEMTARALF